MAIPEDKVKAVEACAGRVGVAIEILENEWPGMTVSDMEEVLTVIAKGIRENKAKGLTGKDE
jgi:hypothetical protein